jgi:hypothetical protein
MAQIILTYRQSLTTDDGREYTPVACGHQQPDGTGEGWLEFVPSDGEDVVQSLRETTQPNRPDLEHWASGLTSVYFEGALDRALTSPPVAIAGSSETPV